MHDVLEKERIKCVTEQSAVLLARMRKITRAWHVQRDNLLDQERPNVPTATKENLQNFHLLPRAKIVILHWGWSAKAKAAKRANLVHLEKFPLEKAVWRPASTRIFLL